MNLSKNTKMSKLKELKLIGNKKLASLSLSKNKKLSHLEVTGSKKLTTLDLSGATWLRDLICDKKVKIKDRLYGRERTRVDYLWILVLLVLGILMVCKPKLLWKIEHLFSVKDGEPTELYLATMCIVGVFCIMCSLGIIMYIFIK